MYHPIEKRKSKLSPADENGCWESDNGRHTVYFERDETGVVPRLTLDADTTFKRS